MERDFVKDCHKQFIWLINLDQDEETIKQKVYQICCLLQVFVVYRRNAKGYAKPIIEELKKNDFSVWELDDVAMGGDWASIVQQEILKIAKMGFLLYLITDDSSSSYAKDELEYAKKSGAKIITFVFNNVPIAEDIKDLLDKKNIYYIPCLPKREDMYLLVDLVKAALKRRIQGAIYFQADALNAAKVLQEKLNYDGNYHEQEAVFSYGSGATDDYIEIYTFPCCGKNVVVGDGPVSRFRYDGCHKGNKKAFKAN